MMSLKQIMLENVSLRSRKKQLEKELQSIDDRLESNITNVENFFLNQAIQEAKESIDDEQ